MVIRADVCEEVAFCRRGMSRFGLHEAASAASTLVAMAWTLLRKSAVAEERVDLISSTIKQRAAILGRLSGRGVLTVVDPWRSSSSSVGLSTH